MKNVRRRKEAGENQLVHLSANQEIEQSRDGNRVGNSLSTARKHIAHSLRFKFNFDLTFNFVCRGKKNMFHDKFSRSKGISDIRFWDLSRSSFKGMKKEISTSLFLQTLEASIRSVTSC